MVRAQPEPDEDADSRTVQLDETATNGLTPRQLEEHRTRGRIRKGTRTEDAFPLQDPFKPPRPFSSFESSFQAQEYITWLVHADPSDVDAICALPLERVATRAGSTDVDDEGEEEMEPLVEADVWVYEHLRRLSLDLAILVSALQKECCRRTCPDMRAQDWLFLCAAHASAGDSECCAIDYIVHTLDGATALLNSSRYFPSRLNVPDTSLKHFTSIARRLYRVFAHAYFHHRKIFDNCEAGTSLYQRFLTLTATFDLVDAELLAIPLAKEDLID